MRFAYLLPSVVTSVFGKTSHLIERIFFNAAEGGMSASFFLVFNCCLTVMSKPAKSVRVVLKKIAEMS
jgi:hypothetical protein